MSVQHLFWIVAVAFGLGAIATPVFLCMIGGGIADENERKMRGEKK